MPRRETPEGGVPRSDILEKGKVEEWRKLPIEDYLLRHRTNPDDPSDRSPTVPSLFKLEVNKFILPRDAGDENRSAIKARKDQYARISFLLVEDNEGKGENFLAGYLKSEHGGLAGRITTFLRYNLSTGEGSETGADVFDQQKVKPYTWKDVRHISLRDNNKDAVDGQTLLSEFKNGMAFQKPPHPESGESEAQFCIKLQAWRDGVVKGAWRILGNKGSYKFGSDRPGEALTEKGRSGWELQNWDFVECYVDGMIAGAAGLNPPDPADTERVIEQEVEKAIHSDRQTHQSSEDYYTDFRNAIGKFLTREIDELRKLQVDDDYQSTLSRLDKRALVVALNAKGLGAYWRDNRDAIAIPMLMAQKLQKARGDVSRVDLRAELDALPFLPTKADQID